MPDFIPPSDAEFDSWQINHLVYLNANLAALGLIALDTDVTADNAGQTAWTPAYAAHIAAQAAAEAARAAKDTARVNFEIALRRLVGRLQRSTSVSDAERQALGITVRDTIPTPVPIPTTKPVLTPDTSARLRITIGFADEGTPTSKAKPFGVVGCELWMKIGGAPPVDLTECEFIALDNRTPKTVEFEGSDANKTVHFIGRWQNSRGEKGPLSETVSATVTG
jgi:hypothetical protein